MFGFGSQQSLLAAQPIIDKVMKQHHSSSENQQSALSAHEHKAQYMVIIMCIKSYI